MLMQAPLPGASLAGMLARQRSAFDSEPMSPWQVRVDRLRRLLELTHRCEARFIAAIDADFSGRSAHESRLAELFVVRAGIRHALRHLRGWMRPRRVPTQVHFLPGSNRLLPQPLGVVGVVAPWNYPLQLALGPAVAALAAGNRVLIKPSELTPRFADALARAVSDAFDPSEVAVVTGDADVARAFVELPFDHLFFTGSTAVGRLVAQAAAKHLVPVTLELGGKSPAILDASCDLGEALPRIAFGKLLNAGQTCIAPDYLLVPSGRGEEVARGLAAAMDTLYPRLRDNPDYTAIVSDRHRQRLLALLDEARAEGARIVEVNPAQEDFSAGTRKLPPALVLGCTPRMRLLQEEIFGPVLPIVEVAGTDAAIAHVRAGDPPLALYWFGRDRVAEGRVLGGTLAGGVTVNDCLWHLAQEHQPFGGVGSSGQGAYHGRWGFDRLSHLKPVFRQARLNGTAMFHPPYGKTFERLLGLLERLA
ncbi:coniferyl aldehyde dehydrogenase [Acidovorax sp. NCPPB 3859]|nr:MULTISPECIES: coniferyl aldehyde dehydrogenase [unclassified Acidovorax]MDA8449024.1 coniferyl aldehyde dehydrogenase [Acidovorax sp. GBBC 3297]MDA8458888.1 coniferyl aldehyde dehydrogenase [Acidovorax sp. GBBC 3333]MDA8463780.1 coniferyl aldehyde dehydrogenase [Acidovorax sp. GBBC 3332]MDA8468812.1 coniferyl aldehyde dehydrogenase [Acidovorax sp. GBBC 3299]WCM80424.1 coniferyl aldehyde dehydrogenase [Acidovorax sp. GBBC 712]